MKYKVNTLELNYRVYKERGNRMRELDSGKYKELLCKLQKDTLSTIIDEMDRCDEDNKKNPVQVVEEINKLGEQFLQKYDELTRRNVYVIKSQSKPDRYKIFVSVDEFSIKSVIVELKSNSEDYVKYMAQLYREYLNDREALEDTEYAYKKYGKIVDSSKRIVDLIKIYENKR